MRQQLSFFIETQRAAVADFWADDLAREGLRDLGIVVAILAVAIKTGMSIAGSDLAAKEPDPTAAVAYQATEAPSIDSVAFSPAPMILPVEDPQQSAQAPKLIEPHETQRPHKGGRRRRG